MILRLIAFLRRLKNWQIWLLLVTVSVLLTEVSVAVLNQLVRGEVTTASMLIGLFSGIVVSSLIAAISISVANFIALKEQQVHEVIARYAESRLSVAIENSQMIIWEYDFIKDEFQYDAAMLRLLDITTESPPQNLQAWIALVHPDDRPAFLEHLQVLLQTDEPIFDVEYRFTRQAGQWGWVHTRGKVVQRTTEGKPQLVVGSTMNITERKQAEAALRESEAKFRTIIETTPVPIALNDAQGNINYLNRTFLQTIGYTNDEIPTLAEWWLCAYPDPQYRHWVVEKWQNNLEEARRTHKAFNPMELDIRCKDGSVRTFMVGAEPLGEGFFDIHLVVLYDITERKRFEIEILRSRQELDAEHRLFHAILDNSPISIWMLGVDGNIKFINRTFCNAVGISEQQFQEAHHYSDVLPPAVTANCIKSDLECMAQDTPHTSMEWLPFVDGREHLLEITKVRLLGQDGNSIGLVGLGVDVTERQHAKELGERHLDELESIYLLSNAISRAASLDQAYEVTMNSMLRLLKADRVSIMLLDEDGVMHFKAWHGLSDAYREAVDGHSPWTRDALDPDSIYVEDIESDGRFANLRNVITAEGIKALCFVPLVQQGRLLGKFMVYFNTPHRFTESEIQLAQTIAFHISFAIVQKRAEQQFSDIFEFAPDAIVITDQHGIITQVNLQVEKLFGYSNLELIGREIDVLMPVDALNVHRDMRQTFIASAVRQRPRNESDRRKNLRAIDKQGRIFPVEISLATMQSQSGMLIAASIRDITDRQQVMDKLRSTASDLEQANAQIEQERAQLAQRVMERTAQLTFANKAKDSFLATMSHEIRTPLGGLLGMMELLNLSPLDTKQRELFQVAHDSGKNLLHIVDDILDWSKIEAGKLELAPHVATIADLLRGVERTYAQLASAKGIRLSYRVDDKLAAAHLFDPLRVAQILNNFISNALKFTAQGDIEIRAERVTLRDGVEEICLSVKDSGMGISRELQSRLFHVYEQGAAETARMYGGTGLGLSICRSLAELMGGVLNVESKVGVGSTFTLTLSLPLASPVALLDFQSQQTKDNSQQNFPDISSLVSEGKQVSVLVVDDHPVNRLLLKKQVMLLGVDVEIAESGSAALALWKKGHFDLIITDCHMPEMDGYELTRNIRQLELQAARPHIPIIAWTANVMTEEEDRCSAAGMDDILTKPTELSELRAMLVKWLDRENQASTGVVIDFDILRKLTKSLDAQVDMLRDLKRYNQSDIPRLLAALNSGDANAVAACAHRIKGACRMVGALELESLCASIEKAAKQGDIDDARATADTTLRAAVARLELAMSRFISAA